MLIRNKETDAVRRTTNQALHKFIHHAGYLFCDYVRCDVYEYLQF